MKNQEKEVKRREKIVEDEVSDKIQRTAAINNMSRIYAHSVNPDNRDSPVQSPSRRLPGINRTSKNSSSPYLIKGGSVPKRFIYKSQLSFEHIPLNHDNSHQSNDTAGINPHNDGKGDSATPQFDNAFEMFSDKSVYFDGSHFENKAAEMKKKLMKVRYQ